MKKILLGVLLSACFWGCQNSPKSTATDKDHLLSFFDHGKETELSLAQGLHYNIIFQSGDTLIAPNGKRVPSKANLDCTVLIPDPKNPKKATLFVSFETNTPDPNLGSGGGGFIAELVYEKGLWRIVGTPHGVDYSPVGQTLNNCGGKTTPYGTILSAEEHCLLDHKTLFPILGDTSEYNGKPRAENFGWMVEIDPRSKKALQKITNFGRFSHEDALCLPDGKTVFLTNDDAPAVLFKFIAKHANDYSQGQLYAYSEALKWIALPMDYTSLADIRAVAISKGATLFTRHEWMTLMDQKLYITETGKDLDDYTPYIQQGGVLASYYSSPILQDAHGRVLCLDLQTNELQVEIEGGRIGQYTFSNPDCITSYKTHQGDYLLINEDIIGKDKNRTNFPSTTNDVFRYNLKTKVLEQVLRSPAGSETTGGIMDAYGNYLLNIQHPDRLNPGPFHTSTLIQITGL